MTSSRPSPTHRTPARGARRGAAVVLALGLALGGLVVRAPAASAAAPLTLTAASFGPSTVTVSGLAVTHVDLSLDLTVDPAQIYPTDRLYALVTRTTPRSDPGAPTYLWAVVTRSGGADAAHGTYTGTITVPSTANGTWALQEVSTTGWIETGQPNPPRTDPGTDGIPVPTLTVTGTHRPVLTLAQSPVLPYPHPTSAVPYTMTATVRYADTGAPIAGFTVRVSHDSDCVDNGTGTALRTGATGTVSRTLSTADGMYCFWTPLPGTTGQVSVHLRAAGWPVYAVRLSAAVSPSTVEVGGQASVTGSVAGLFPGTRPRVVLQQLVGNRWASVGSALVRASGRYTLVATPASAGTFSYRIWLPSQLFYQGTVTKPLHVVAR